MHKLNSYYLYKHFILLSTIILIVYCSFRSVYSQSFVCGSPPNTLDLKYATFRKVHNTSIVTSISFATIYTNSPMSILIATKRSGEIWWYERSTPSKGDQKLFDIEKAFDKNTEFLHLANDGLMGGSLTPFIPRNHITISIHQLKKSLMT